MRGPIKHFQRNSICPSQPIHGQEEQVEAYKVTVTPAPDADLQTEDSANDDPLYQMPATMAKLETLNERSGSYIES